MFRAHTAALLLACSGPPIAAQNPTPDFVFPKPAVDYTGIDRFYEIADILVKDADPTDAEWNTLLSAPGYRLFGQQRLAVRDQMIVALKPSRHAERDSVLRSNGDAAFTLRHLIRAVELRSGVDATRRALEHSIQDSIDQATRATARFLPPGTVERGLPPFIAFAVFADDGYSLAGGILLDPLNVRENGLTALLSHELHHAFLGLVDKTAGSRGTLAPDAALATALIALRTEGIADQIDKPHPLPLRGNALDVYVKRYNETYDRTPVVLRSIDSLLAIVADSPSVARAAGAKARQLLWSNSHPNGAYIARTIVETFGIDSLMPAMYNAFAMLRTYASAERKRGNPAPFSPKALSVLDALEKRYVRP